MNSTEFIPFTIININPTTDYGIGEITGIHLFVRSVQLRFVHFNVFIAHKNG